MYKMFSERERKVISVHKTRSTNNDVKAVIQGEDYPVFTCITANEQTDGRGRLGRSFFSPDGGLYFSLSYPLAGNENNIPFMTLLAGLAVSEAIEELTGTATQIKWPNDIYLNGKKLGGILCELVCKNKLTAVVGAGINLTAEKKDIPCELKDRMTSFAAEGLTVPDRKALVDKIISRLDKYIYEDGTLYGASDDILTCLRSRSYSIGKTAEYKVGDVTFKGIITDIRSSGAAEITLGDGTVKEIFCGEITQ